MKQSKKYYIYIATNRNNTVLYTGVTNNLIRRIWEHKQKLISSFASKYNITKLIYYEIFDDVRDAIEREKQIKAGSRLKKIQLVESINPTYGDLYDQIVQ